MTYDEVIEATDVGDLRSVLVAWADPQGTWNRLSYVGVVVEINRNTSVFGPTIIIQELNSPDHFRHSILLEFVEAIF